MRNGVRQVQVPKRERYKAVAIFLLYCGLTVVALLKGVATLAAVNRDDDFKSHLSRGALGKVIPSLPAVTESGEKIDLAMATKGWKVIYFWSSSCPCVRVCQSLSLFPLSRTYKERGVAFYAVASNSSDFTVQRLGNGKERAFIRLSNEGNQFPPYPIVIDAKQKVADLLKAHSASHTFILDPQNRVVFSGDPDDAEEIRRKTGRGSEKTKDYLENALKEGLAGKSISRPLTPVLGCEIERPNIGKSGVTKP